MLKFLAVIGPARPGRGTPKLGGEPFARFLANGGVVPQATTPSAPGFAGFAAFSWWRSHPS